MSPSRPRSRPNRRRPHYRAWKRDFLMFTKKYWISPKSPWQRLWDLNLWRLINRARKVSKIKCCRNRQKSYSKHILRWTHSFQEAMYRVKCGFEEVFRDSDNTLSCSLSAPDRLAVSNFACSEAFLEKFSVSCWIHSSVPGDRNCDEETQRWIWASFLQCGLETRWPGFGAVSCDF